MIAIDASALLAIYFGEAEEPQFRRTIEVADVVMSPVNYWEAMVKAHREHGPEGAQRVELLAEALGIEIVAVTGRDARAAYAAFARFGKGRGGPLNLGDCFAYALAQAESRGLLYTGDDFGKTDVKSAL